jgi:pentatricopeptide repeat protein
MKQALGRAMGLVAEMRALGVERNVHTYTALMNVCIKCQECGEALKIFEHMRDVRPRGRPRLACARLRCPPRRSTAAWHSGAGQAERLARHLCATFPAQLRSSRSK